MFFVYVTRELKLNKYNNGFLTSEKKLYLYQI